jgi:hypothetical protein
MSSVLSSSSKSPDNFAEGAVWNDERTAPS